MAVKKILKQEEGVAFFEFIFFLPLMVLLMGLLVSIGNSINGSINQQKIARSYFYSRISNNSLFPLKNNDPNSNQKFWKSFGMFFIGWREKSEGEFPVQPCYKFRLPFAGEEQSCQEYRKNSTEYVRVGTVYGACGATYVVVGQQPIRAPRPTATDLVSSYHGCTIRE